MSVGLLKLGTYHFLLFATLFSLSFISGCAGSYDGETLFRNKGCLGCHSFRGRGGSLGPDLTAVSQRRNADWIEVYIRNPMENNPRARMPGFNHLSKMERKELVKFLSES